MAELLYLMALKKLTGGIHEEVGSHNCMLDRMHAKGSKLLGSRAFSAIVARLADLCNGERVVIFLFVSCILFSTPSSLAPEAATLLILSFAALLAEISTEGSRALSQFKTRPGASSGMLLGSVTMPAAMLSRLILVSRAISQHHVGSEDFSYISMLYWAVSACNFGALILCLTLQNPPGDTSSRLGGVPASIYSLFCTILYMCSCYMSLSANSYAAWHATMNLLWYLCHGIATVALIRHILHKFPYCASIGEALLVTSGLVLYAGDMLALSLSKVFSFHWSIVVPLFLLFVLSLG